MLQEKAITTTVPTHPLLHLLGTALSALESLPHPHLHPQTPFLHLNSYEIGMHLLIFDVLELKLPAPFPSSTQ